MQQRFLKSLLNLSSYPDTTSAVHLIQTHVSFLFLTDKYVYKIKKPVDFGFLNFTTLDRRRFYCNEEVRLNRRLSPDMYLGVEEVRESLTGPSFKGDGRIIDYAVKMLRLPEECMLDRMLAEGRVTCADMQLIARRIAEFHLTADRGAEIDSCGSADSIFRNCEENFQQISEFVNITLSRHDLNLIRKWVENFMTRNAALFADRVHAGFIRDCDGDIHLENICLADQLYIFDCIEFNYRFRYSDTTADIAFLLMDLDFHRESGFGAVFLDEYIRVTGDRDVTRLLDFYKIYRAMVRGKVESFKLHDPHIPAEVKQRARDSASRYFRLARGYILRESLSPTLFITCGPMGTGKSTLVGELALQLGLENLSSDVVRKTRAGISPTTHATAEYNEGIYTKTATSETYRELLRLAENLLVEGRSVIIDATFGHRAYRENLHAMAERIGVSFCIIRLQCPEKIIKQRLDGRIHRRGEISDGEWQLYLQQKKEFEYPGNDEGLQIFIDTSKPLFDTIDTILNEIGIL